MSIQIQKIEKIFDKITQKKQIHEAVLYLEDSSGNVSYNLDYGGKGIDTPILMASITKLFTSTCIFILSEQGKLSLHDRISKYVNKDVLSQLHVYKGQDYSNELTVWNLLSHTSGLRDAIEEASNESKKRAIDKDKERSFNDIISKSKDTKPHFAPNSNSRSHYTNINFDLLGKLVEKVTNMPLEEVYKQFIIEFLGLKHTYLPLNEKDFIPNVYYKDKSLYRPKGVISSRASGGCVSTTRDLMIFIKAFFGGLLFSKDIFSRLKVSNRLQISMYPIRYGLGYMTISLNGLPTLFMGKGELFGHSGSTGSFAFYYPEKDIFFAGDVNQMAQPAIPIRLVMQLAMAIK